MMFKVIGSYGNHAIQMMFASQVAAYHSIDTVGESALGT